MTEHPVHVAIPSFNNAEGLGVILPQLLKQPFTTITVLDDASTDTTAQVIQNFPGVRYIKSKENLGPAQAKNLILEQLPENGLLLLLDSDMVVRTTNIPKLINHFVSQHPKVGVVGGAIRSPDGGLMHHLFGYDFSIPRVILSKLVSCVKPLLGTQWYQKLTVLFRMDFANERDRKVDWVAEGFCFIRIDLFRSLGGFHRWFKRFHEGPEFCYRVRKLGYEVWFTNSVTVENTDQNTGTAWLRTYHLIRSSCSYYLLHPSRLVFWRYPRP